MPALAKRGFLVVLASIALVAPCYWQSRVQAGDLASHLYNAWLAQLVDEGRAPGVELAWQSTNVLFDWILGALLRGLGPGPAERIAAGLAVLVFAWGAFAFLSAVSKRRVWDLLPCIAMLAYGWVFHIGFFNFYLGLGLCLWALAVTWDRPASRLIVALPILVLAWTAHALPVAWAVALIAFSWLWRRLPTRHRAPAFVATLALLWIASALVGRVFLSRWTPEQWALASGADQLRVFDAKYNALAWALVGAWLALLAESLATDGVRGVIAKIELSLFGLCAAGIVLVPGTILLPGYGHALVFIAQRMSLTAAVMACAVVTSNRSRFAAPAFGLIAVVFFAFLYRDERILNQFEDRLDAVVAQVPPDQRVLLGVRDPTLRVNALAHMIDRACIDRCYSYANYEASTRQFRVRVEGPNRIVASTYADSSAMQTGGYVVQARDLPLYQVVLDPGGRLTLQSLAAGASSRMSSIRILPDLY